MLAGHWRDCQELRSRLVKPCVIKLRAIVPLRSVKHFPARQCFLLRPELTVQWFVFVTLPVERPIDLQCRHSSAIVWPLENCRSTQGFYDLFPSAYPALAG